MESRTDRRSEKRIPTRVSVSIRSGQAQPSSGETRDLSASGIFLYTTNRVTKGDVLEMVLLFPAELTRGQKQWICCQAEVLRVEEGSTGQLGLAASIRHLDTLPEIPT